MRRSTAFTLLALLCVSSACVEEDGPTAPGEPRLDVALQADVEALIGTSMAGWWRSAHGRWPGPALSTAADAHTSSWRNWGMLDAGREPRQPLNQDPGYDFTFTHQPWRELHRTLAAVRDGLVAIREGVTLGEDGEDTQRAVAFGKFMQGMALGQLAQLYERAFVLDELADPSTLASSPYQDVAAAALAAFDQAIGIAEQEQFTIPASWVGFDRALRQDELARLARSWRARIAISVARSPAERAAADWSAVLADVREGIQNDWGSRYDGNYEVNWGWALDKLYLQHPAWGRLDYRTIGPADASGAYQAWLATPPHERMPFPIDTDDRRITGGDPLSPGTYAAYDPDILFRPQRGTDHFSYYADTRWAHLLEDEGVGLYTDFPVSELDFIEAEALYRLGDRAGAMAIVNEWRAHGQLPPFAGPNARAPGGERCVPRRPDGSCGDLWDALAYEKRIEIYHYGPFTEYLDDRGWGDLVEGTFLEFPAPSQSLPDLLESLYQEAGVSLSASAANDSSAEAIRAKREAWERFDQARNSNPGDVGAG